MPRYEVQPGDSAASIAAKVYSDPRLYIEALRQGAIGRVKPGQVLDLPSEDELRARSGRELQEPGTPSRIKTPEERAQDVTEFETQQSEEMQILGGGGDVHPADVAHLNRLGISTETTEEGREFFQDVDQMQQFVQDARRGRTPGGTPVAQRNPGDRLFLSIVQGDDGELVTTTTTEETPFPLYYDPEGRRLTPDQTNIPAIAGMVTEGVADINRAQAERSARQVQAGLSVPVTLSQRELETIGQQMQAIARVRPAIEEREEDAINRSIESQRILQTLQQQEAQLKQELEQATAEVEREIRETEGITALESQADEAEIRRELEETQNFIERVEGGIARAHLQDYREDAFTFTFGDNLSFWEAVNKLIDGTIKRAVSPAVRKIPVLGTMVMTGATLAGPAAKMALNNARLQLNTIRSSILGQPLSHQSVRDNTGDVEERVQELEQQREDTRRELASISENIDQAEGMARLELVQRQRQLQSVANVQDKQLRAMAQALSAHNQIQFSQDQLEAVWTFYAGGMMKAEPVKRVAGAIMPVLNGLGIEGEDIFDALQVIVDASNEVENLAPGLSSVVPSLPDIDVRDVFESAEDRQWMPAAITENDGLTDEEAYTLHQFAPILPSLAAGRGAGVGAPQNVQEMSEKIRQSGEIRRRLEREATSIRARDIPQLIEIGELDLARERMREAIARELQASTWDSPEFAYTWITHPEREEAFYDAWVEAELQKYAQTGEYMNENEIWRLKQRFIDPFNEVASEIAMEAILLLPDKAWETLISKAWGGLKMGGSAVFDVARVLPPIDWFTRQSSRSVAHELSTGFTDATRLLARRGAVQTVGDADSMVQIMETAGRYALTGSDEVAEELPRIGRTWTEHMRRVGKVFADADLDRVHQEFHSTIESLHPENWPKTVRQIQEEILEETKDNIRRQFEPEVAAGNMTETELREMIELNARRAADNPKNIASAFGDRVQDGYIALRTPMVAGPGSNVLDDSLIYQFYRFARWLDEKFIRKVEWDASSPSDFLTRGKSVRFFGWLRNTWTGLILSARVGWTMINLQDSTARFLLEGESIFDDFFSLMDTNYERAMKNGVVPEELMQTFQRYNLEESQEVGRRLLRGEKPAYGPIGFISYEWKRLAEEGPDIAFSEAPLGWAFDRLGRGAKAWLGGWHDTNSAIEFVLRMRMFGNKYADNFLKADTAALARWEKRLARMDLTDDQRQFLLDLWAQSEDNPERMRQIMNSLVEGRDGGNPLWTVFTPPELRARLKGLTPMERMTITRSVNRQLRNLTARAAAEGRHIEVNEINDLFNTIIRSVREELADVSSDARRHTIREVRQHFDNKPDFDAVMPDPDDIDTTAKRNPRRRMEVAQEQPSERAVEELSDVEAFRSAEDTDTFVQRVSDATDPFARTEIADDVDGLIETVVDRTTGRATIRMHPSILDEPVERVNELVQNEVRGILEIEDRILIRQQFDDAADYRSAVDNFLDDPQALKESDPRAFRFVATQLEAAPDHARVLEALNQRKLTGLLDPEEVLLDATSDVGRRVHDLSKRDLYGEWGKKIGPQPGYYRAGQRSHIARGRFNSLANELEIAGEGVGESAAAVMGGIDRRIGEVRDRLFNWIYHDWPGPVPIPYGRQRSAAWEKAFQLKERIYNGTAGWFDELTERARQAESLEDLRVLDGEISVAELMNRSGFGLSPDEELVSIRGARGLSGSSSVRAVGGLIDAIPGVQTWDDLFRPYREVLEEAQRAKPGTHMREQAQEMVQRIQPLQEEVVEAVEEAAPQVIESNRVMEAYSRARIRSGFKSWGLTSEQADGIMTVVDGQANIYAQYTGRSKADFYLRNWGDVVVGGDPAADALFQRGRATFDEFLQRYNIHRDSGLWISKSAPPSDEAAREFFRKASRNDLTGEDVIEGLGSMDADMKLIVNGMAALERRPATEIADELIAAAGGPDDMDDLFRSRMGDLFQTSNDAVRGSTEFMDDGRAIVRGFEDANVSTALHESNHVFVRSLQRISDESDLARRDLKIMEDFLEEEVGLTKAAGEWTEEMHEEIARRYERYFRDGEAPSPELAGLFERFRQWLTDIYEQLRGSPLFGKSVEGTELQEVFDRWTRAAVQPFEELDEGDRILRISRAMEAGALDTLPTNARLAVEDQARFMKEQALESQPGRRFPVEGQDAPEVESSTRPDWYRLLRYGTDHKNTPSLATRWTGDPLPEYKKGGLPGKIADSIDRMLAGEPPANVLDERVRQVVALEMGNKTADVPGVRPLPNFAFTAASEGPEAAIEEARRFLADNPDAAESPEELLRLFHGDEIELARRVEGPPPVRQTVLETPVTEMDDPKLAETVKMEVRNMMEDIRRDRPALWRETTQLDDEVIVEQLDNIRRGIVPEENVADYDRVRELIDMNLDSGVLDLQTDEFIRPGYPHYHRLADTPREQVESMARMWNDMDESPPSIEDYLQARMKSGEFEQNADAMWETFAAANGLDLWGDDVISSPDRFRAFLVSKIDDMAEEGYDEWAPEVMEAMDQLLRKVDNYMSLRSDWGWAVGLEPSQIRGARMRRPTIPLPEWNMPRPFRKWLQHVQSEQAKANRVLGAMEDWRNWLVENVESGNSLFSLRETPLNQLESMRDAVEAGARLKDDAVDISIHGDTRDAFPELGKGLEDYRFGHSGMTGAIEETNWAMLDYTTRYNIDEIMRNVVPFWMFPSRSIPYWMETITRHPRIASMYARYRMFSQRQAYQEGAVMSNGEQLPSLEGYIPVPGTDMWFNLSAPLSARYVMELAGHWATEKYGLRSRRGSFDEQNEESPILAQLMRHALEGQRLFGIYMGPWVSLPIYGANKLMGTNIHTDFPNFSLIPQFDLIPVWWQRSLLGSLNRATGGLVPETLSPEVAWKDYLIEREMLEMALERIQSGELTPAEQERLISDVKAALGYRRVPNEDRGGAGFELMHREDHDLWQEAKRRVEKRDLVSSWTGYFTGVYPKFHTDARAALLQVRDDINRLRDSLNNEFAADLFLPYQDAEQMWDFYVNRAYETNEGAVAGLYGSISWTQLPGGEQAHGLDRRQIVAANVHRETMTDQYYSALIKAIEERNEKLQQAPIGDRDRRSEIWREYFRQFDMIDSSPAFEIVRRDWVSGNKPDELLEEEFRNRFFYMMRSTKPGFREAGHQGETYNEYLERVAEWEEDLPQISQQWVNHYISVEVAPRILGERQKLMKIDGIWTYKPDPEATPRRIVVPADLEIFGDKLINLRDMAESFADEFDAGTLEEWDKANDTPGDALNRGWEDLIWSPYWDIFEGGNRFGNEIAEREFLEYASQIDMDTLIDWVLEEYPNRGWSKEDLLQWAKGGIQPLEEEIEAENEIEVMEEDIWDILLMVGPDDEAFQNELDEIMDFGSSRLNVWYENQAGSFKDEESFAEFHEAVMQAAANLDLDSPDRQTLLEWNEAKQLNDELQNRLTSAFGDTFVREIMVPYWRLNPIFDKEERDEMKEENPQIEQYNEFKEEFARDNPIYAKYYMKHIWEELQEGGDPGASGTGSGGRRSSTPGTSRQSRTSSGGGVRGGGPSLEAPDVPAYFPLGYRGGAAGRPMWPAGAGSTIGTAGTHAIRRMFEERVPLPDFTVEFLRGVAERHPEWETWVARIIEISQKLKAGETIDVDYEDIELLDNA